MDLEEVYQVNLFTLGHYMDDNVMVMMMMIYLNAMENVHIDTSDLGVSGRNLLHSSPCKTQQCLNSHL